MQLWTSNCSKTTSAFRSKRGIIADYQHALENQNSSNVWYAVGHLHQSVRCLLRDQGLSRKCGSGRIYDDWWRYKITGSGRRALGEHPLRESSAVNGQKIALVSRCFTPRSLSLGNKAACLWKTLKCWKFRIVFQKTRDHQHIICTNGGVQEKKCFNHKW